MRTLPQALEIIFEVQRKRNNEKIARRKISFSTYKNILFFFAITLTFKASNFLIFSSF
jgi:hypothetical protein